MRRLLLGVSLGLVVACGGQRASQHSSESEAEKQEERTESSRTPRDYLDEGLASYYGPGLEGRPTASGEKVDLEALTAAHRTLPFGTCLRVVNMENGRSVQVRVNDRGPFVKGRVIDVSLAAAKRLDMVDKGLARVRLYRCKGSTG